MQKKYILALLALVILLMHSQIGGGSEQKLPPLNVPTKFHRVHAESGISIKGGMSAGIGQGTQGLVFEITPPKRFFIIDINWQMESNQLVKSRLRFPAETLSQNLKLFMTADSSYFVVRSYDPLKAEIYGSVELIQSLERSMDSLKNGE